MERRLDDGRGRDAGGQDPSDAGTTERLRRPNSDGSGRLANNGGRLWDQRKPNSAQSIVNQLTTEKRVGRSTFLICLIFFDRAVQLPVTVRANRDCTVACGANLALRLGNRGQTSGDWTLNHQIPHSIATRTNSYSGTRVRGFRYGGRNAANGSGSKFRRLADAADA